MTNSQLINLAYILSAFFFVLGLKMLNSPAKARMGNLMSALGMLIAITAAFFHAGLLDFRLILLALLLGSLIGAITARFVKMTQMPEMVALFNGSGGIAALLVGWGEYHANPMLSFGNAVTLFLSVVIGGLSFSGSLAAWGKLRELFGGKPICFPGQKFFNLLLLLTLLIGGVVYSLHPAQEYPLFLALIGVSFLMGVMVVLPIGGADMPVVISLLNSYTGMAACAAGFVLQNIILIVAGALVGASGFILTRLMCKAMNRPLSNVLFSGFGKKTSMGGCLATSGEVKSLSVEEAYYVLEAAQCVVVVPGYGMAVAQAQHAVHELANILEENGCEVKYAIHPVAGRMPGHMNVLLAEANIPYDQLVEMDDINSQMETVDVCLVIGANDVVNPAARNDLHSPIYGMPIINADKARHVFVLKRSMASGFAGIDNPLFCLENTRMIFGDAKGTLMALIGQFKQK